MTDPYPTGPVVYILRNGKSLYVGATIDLSHRIRQHNGELSGGAHRTSTKGPGWVCLLYVQGFQSRTESLQFEYALKREAKHARLLPVGGRPQRTDFFARWIRRAYGSAPLGGWGLSGTIWGLQRNPEANPEASYP